jgi:hypothetical protein
MESFCETGGTSTKEASPPGQRFTEPLFDLDRIARTPYSVAARTVSTRSLLITSSLDTIPEDGTEVSFPAYSLPSSERSLPDENVHPRPYLRRGKRRRCPTPLSMVGNRRLDVIRSAYAEAMAVVLQDAPSCAKRILDKQLGSNSCYAFETFQAEFPTYARPFALIDALSEKLAEDPRPFAVRCIASETQEELNHEMGKLRREMRENRPDMLVNIDPSVDNVVVAVGIEAFYRAWSQALASPLLPALAWSRFIFCLPEAAERSDCQLEDMQAFQKLVLMKLNELVLEWIHNSQPEYDSLCDSECDSAFTLESDR